MRKKPVALRTRADQDISEAINFYLDQGAPDAASGFVDALEKAILHLSRHSASGSSRLAHTLNLPGLKSWSLRGYPWSVFYFDHADHVDIWRVLHQHRDIPRWLQEE